MDTDQRQPPDDRRPRGLRDHRRPETPAPWTQGLRPRAPSRSPATRRRGEPGADDEPDNQTSALDVRVWVGAASLPTGPATAGKDDHLHRRRDHEPGAGRPDDSAWRRHLPARAPTTTTGSHRRRRRRRGDERRVTWTDGGQRLGPLPLHRRRDGQPKDLVAESADSNTGPSVGPLTTTPNKEH